jgi:hypothetical protein
MAAAGRPFEPMLAASAPALDCGGHQAERAEHQGDEERE